MAHAFDPNEEKELEQLLTENYNYLVKHISAREFIPHLISKEVLTTEDKEEIESKVTSVDRAGRLIDLVKMRGFKGMYQFMLVLEFDLPFAYIHVRKREAREPPSDWLELRRANPSLRKRRSRDSMTHVTNLIGRLMKELDQQRTAVDHIMDKMKDVKTLQCETTEEQEKDWKIYETQLTEMEDRYALVSKELVESKKLHEELKVKYEAVRIENEELLNQRKEDRTRLTSLQTRYDQLHQDLDSMTSRQSRIGARDSTNNVQALQDEIGRLSSLLQSSTQKQDEEKLARLERHLQELGQRNAEFNADMMSAQEQRDKTMKDLKKAEDKLNEQETQITSLTEENQTHHKRTDDLMKKIGDLEHELYWRWRSHRRQANVPVTPTTPDPDKALQELSEKFEFFSAK